MVIFYSYVKLPEGFSGTIHSLTIRPMWLIPCHWLAWVGWVGYVQKSPLKTGSQWWNKISTLWKNGIYFPSFSDKHDIVSYLKNPSWKADFPLINQSISLQNPLESINPMIKLIQEKTFVFFSSKHPISISNNSHMI